MKHILKFISLLFIALYVGCTTTEVGMDQIDVLKLSINKINVDASQHTESVTITSHCLWKTRVEYSDNNSDWIKLQTKAGGIGTEDLIITINENTATTEARKAIIYVYNTDYNLYQSIDVYQKASEPFITLNTTNAEVEASGDDIYVNVKSNVDYKIHSNASWAKTSITQSKKGEKKITITVDSNPDTEIRSATIIFINSDHGTIEGTAHAAKSEFIITQKALVPEIECTTKSIESSANGVNKSITVNSSIEWKASCYANWVTLTPASGNKGTSTMSIKVAANIDTTPREAVVRIYNTEYNIEKQITISQEKLPAYAILYTSSDGKVVTPNKTNVFGASIISNTNTNGIGIIVFNSPITSIGKEAFRYCSNLTDVTIPDSVITIGERAFDDCTSLPNVTIGSNVASIGDFAFRGCSSLTSVTIPDSVTEIGNEAFAYCNSLQEFRGKFASKDGRCLIVDGTLISFAPAGLTEYTIPDSVTTIGDSAFSGCGSLTSVTIGNNVTTIGEWAFSRCEGLTSVTIPDSVTTIGNNAFYYCSSLTSVTIPNSVTTIGDNAFAYCYDLTSVTIPDSVTAIGDNAFYSCSSLTSVTIPDSVTTIGSSAFRSCDSLTSVYCKPTTPPAGGYDMFYDNASGREIYVPMESVEAYKSASYWSYYKSDIVGYNF